MDTAAQIPVPRPVSLPVHLVIGGDILRIDGQDREVQTSQFSGNLGTVTITFTDGEVKVYRFTETVMWA